MKLNVSEAQIKLWCGWVQSSDVWDKYIRNPVFLDDEVEFARNLFSQVLPALL